ncbi:protein of unknown function [Acidithiobacillus ferrivorans]|uniref:Uncharacterized protein n=1 Tax=Acidithiobacillus ferrivorans TaxID=160808 RepID=A0ABY1MS85_9PROT|nr:DUF4337 family protein [Acidithiobacillus ferrivorans]SMH65723.1 protein of unknown function [Acidithiobacillus ferrivorans]
MSEGLHTHAPHEEAVHEAAESHNPKKHSLYQWVAIFTALLATIGAIVSYQGTHLMNEVLLAKNEAVLEKAKATDQWNYYQAISTKEHLMDLAVAMTPTSKNAPFHMGRHSHHQTRHGLSSPIDCTGEKGGGCDRKTGILAQLSVWTRGTGFFTVRQFVFW